ncbi:MAG: hypothetical protein KDA24_12395 [Deltaproteobacteria bacterium]|nr:hypothetical protein [Deltaproteobacteria bacterium]
MTCRASLLGLLLVVGVLAPTTGWAQDSTLCVSADTPATAGRCSQCDGPHYASFAAATAAASALPDVGDSRPEVSICLDTPGSQHTETVRLDNTGGVFGRPLSLDFGEIQICPGTLAPGEPVVMLTTSARESNGLTDSIRDLTIDVRPSSSCPNSEAAGLVINGEGGAAVGGVVIAGTRDFGLATGEGGAADDLFVEDSSFLNVRGAALLARGFANVVRSEFTGGAVGESSVARGAVVAEGGGEIVLRSSVVHGNTAAGGAAEAVIVGPVLFANSVVAANVGVDLPIARIGYGGRGFYETPEGLAGFFVFKDSVFARNRVVGSAPGAPPEVAPAGLPNQADGDACAGVSISNPFHLRGHPGDGLGLGDSPLIQVVTEEGPNSFGEFVAGTSWFVENATAGDALIEIDGGGEAFATRLLHSTFAGNEVSTLVALTEVRTDGEFVALRNLVEHVGGTVFEVAGTPASIMVSTNLYASAPTHDLSPAEALIDAPNFVEPEFRWLTADDVRLFSSCGRFSSACASAASSECESWRGGELVCAADAAAGYVPDLDWLGGLPDQWPWESDFFVSGTGAGWTQPGATGWRCDPVRPTADGTPGPNGTDWGDGDGFPDALDCDNEDVSVQPSVPAPNGYGSPECLEASGDCYTCPEGSTLVESDDDDTGTSGSSGDSCEDDPENCVPTGCLGCGVPLVGTVAWAPLLLLPLGFRRRP